MSRAGYQTAPLPSPNMPPGIPYIVGNEAAERFSFYGMRGILVVYMTKRLLNRGGEPAPMTEDEAKYYFHLFEAGAYLFPIVGGFLSDVLWGKYRTIIGLSLVYCLGHVALAADETRLTDILGIVSVVRYPREIKFFNMLDTRGVGAATVECCDLLLPLAGETFGSSARESDVDVLRRKLTTSSMYRQLVDAGGDPDVFEAYLQLFQGNPVRRAGYGLGFDRLIQYLWGAHDVAAVIPFPVDARYGLAYAVAS